MAQSVDAHDAWQRLGGRLFATTTEVAAILGYDHRTIRKAIDAGEIPSIRLGATRRVPVAWITDRVGLSVNGGPDR